MKAKRKVTGGDKTAVVMDALLTHVEIGVLDAFLSSASCIDQETRENLGLGRIGRKRLYNWRRVFRVRGNSPFCLPPFCFPLPLPMPENGRKVSPEIRRITAGTTEMKGSRR
ncbi:hypothetical protein LXL04_012266 [Taraxacum kok-saghyz]